MPSWRKFCRKKAYRWPDARLPNTARACRSRRQMSAKERLPARPKVKGGNMQLDLSGHHVEVTAALRGYVLKKFERILRHFEALIDVHWVLPVEKKTQQAEGTLMVRGNK